MPRLFSPPENCDVAERNDCATFPFSHNCAIFAMERNFGWFWAVLALIICHFGEIWGLIGPLSTDNLSFLKFVAVYPKIATSCLHTFFTLDATGVEWLD